MRSTSAIPIIGDEPAGIYVDEAAASAVRDQLVPLADIVTPNAFELGWLSGRAISDGASASLGRTHSRPARSGRNICSRQRWEDRQYSGHTRRSSGDRITAPDSAGAWHGRFLRQPFSSRTS